MQGHSSCHKAYHCHFIHYYKQEITMKITMPTSPKFNSYYQKHQKLLRLRGMQPKTIDAYSRAIKRIGNFFNGRIDDLTPDELLDYFSALLESHSWSAVKLDLYGLKFFYTRVLNRTWDDIPLIKPPKTTRIPDILSVAQVNQLFAATDKMCYKIFFYTIYSMGLRLGEGIKLKVGDIDSENMRVHIRDAKGNKDRLVPLPEQTLHILRSFWLTHQHSYFIFPSRQKTKVDLPMDRGGIQSAIKAVVTQLGIKKNFMPFSAPQLCHPFAGGRS